MSVPNNEASFALLLLVRGQILLQGQLGDFPDCLEGIILGKESNGGNRQKRQAAVVRVIMRKLLSGLSRIHSLGLIHRDVIRCCTALFR